MASSFLSCFLPRTFVVLWPLCFGLVFRVRVLRRQKKSTQCLNHPICSSQDLKVKGPLGELALTYPPEVELTEEDSGFLRVRKTVETRRAKEMHGLFRTLTDNMVVGVSKGFEKTLELKGVGYRAMVQGKELVLNLGFSHPVKIEIPDSLKVKVDKKIIIFVSGYDKCEIGQFAATVRKWRPAEPYKRIGVCYSDEIVHRKKGKDRKLK
ncbi:BnaC02g12270D [Brassica napus]|uniref:BnaC02g12270D protein n=1 Tax=Brassica napus TaxID=3708 RepID=A0A078HVQ2_BRANA|nr:BnaC02g12270D [Brassica napus]